MEGYTKVTELLKMDGKKIRQTISNCVIAVANDEILKGKLFYNELTGRIELIGFFPWKRQTLNLTDNDINQIRIRFDSLYGLTSEKGIPRAVEAVAHQNSYHPIRKKLESLKWDKKPRIRHALKRFLGVPESDFSYEAMKVFMLGAIERVYTPGCKFEYILCIVGEQGIGKSTFFRFLAINDVWFYDGIKKFGEKETIENIQGVWICELSEMLATANAKKVEEIKSFISTQIDKYRVPYARYTEDRYRQCVFCGTTNSTDFLPMDRTGNRRFIPFMADRNNMDVHILENEKESREYIEQMWAEAMQIYYSGNFKLTLSKESTAILEENQASFMPEDTQAGMVQDWLDRTAEEYVCTLMIWRECFHNLHEPRRWELSEIANIMDHSVKGWKRYPTKSQMRRLKQPYGRQRCWQRDGDGFIEVDKEECKKLPF